MPADWPSANPNCFRTAFPTIFYSKLPFKQKLRANFFFKSLKWQSLNYFVRFSIFQLSYLSDAEHFSLMKLNSSCAVAM